MTQGTLRGVPDMNMYTKDIERELAASGWMPRLGSDQPILKEEIQAKLRGQHRL
jgi:hypothetical protein